MDGEDEGMMGRFAGALGVGMLLASSAAIADPAAGTTSADSGALEEIVVTAERRQESAQNVGISMDVLSGNSLDAKGVTYVNDLQNAVPSLQIEPAFGSGQPEFRLRGVGFIDYTSNNASPVGVSIDDVALALPIQTQGLLFDIDRIEVLYGPQGTLYGRNTTGGEINFITNRPTAETHAAATVEFGSFDEFKSEGFISGSLLDGLKGRLSYGTEQGGGWQYDRLNGDRLGDKDKIALRGQLELDRIEGLDLRLTTYWSQDKSDEIGLHLLDDYPVGGKTTLIPADSSRYATGWQLNPTFASLIGISPNSRPGLDNLNEGADLAGNLDVGSVRVTSVTAFNRMIRREYSDWDATQYDDSDEYFRSYLSVISQELRVASTGAGPLSWVAGVFYSDQRLNENFYSDLSNSFGGIALTDYGQNAVSFGEFGQVNYRFGDALKVTLGAREDHESRDLVNLNSGFIVPVEPFNTGLNRSTTSNLPSGKFEVDYTPQAGTLVYESVSRGVKSGGFTAHNTIAGAATDPFEPEKLTAYEVGIKSDVTATLRVDLAGFYYRYRDQQILGTIYDPVYGLIGRFVNADSRLDGGEAQLEWHPLPALSISQYYGFVEGYYTSNLIDNTVQPAVNYNTRPESIPKNTYGGDVSYTWDIGGYKLTAESNYSFHDTYSQFFLLGSNAFTIPAYWLANANLSLSPAGGPWTLSLWGRNIFNRDYDVTRNFFLSTSNVAQSGDPATFGIRFNYRY
jgi:outer membrane receptor protein involved in Fe transport